LRLVNDETTLREPFKMISSKKETRMKTNQIHFGAVQIGIILLALSTALIHLTLSFPDPVFILNGLGYLGLTAALFLPLPFLRDRRNLVRYVLMGFTLITIIVWIAIGMRVPLGYIAKVIEITLLVLLWIDRK
jgi:hypothetical protein